jgi:PAS domain S-box-containing protein
VKLKNLLSEASVGPVGKKLQQAFLASLVPEDTLGQLFEMLPNVYFFVKDTEGRFMRMNPALLQAIGFRDETEVLGFTDADLFSPFLAHGYREEDRWIVSRNRPVRDKIWFVPNSQGVLVCYLCSKAPLHDGAGRVIGIAGVMRDARSAGAIIGPYEDLKPAVDYLNSHFSENITIESVAAKVHLSTSQFQRRFRALFQTSPIQYLLQLRIDSACQQLQRTDASLGSIAIENGFYDQSVFCRQFQKRIGLTPRQYRARFGKGAKWKPSSP